MTPLLLAAVLVLPATPGADAPGSPKTEGPKLDTSFLRQYAETRGFLLGRPAKPKVTPDGKAVLFLRSEAKSPRQSLFEFDVATGKTKELLTPDMLKKGADDNLTPEEKARRERQRVTAGGFADYHLSPDGGRVLVKLGNTLYVLDRATGKTRELMPGGDGAIVDPKWSPDGKQVGYVRGYDVVAYDLASNEELPVTTGGTVEKTHGLAEFVAQEEMGRHSGFWWSPDSKSIAYTEADHAGVEKWYVADPLRPEVPPQPQFYPRPGKKNVAVRLGVKPVAGGETVWVDWDRTKSEYLVRVTWDKYGPLTLWLQNRKQDEIDLHRADPATGRAQRLFTFWAHPGHWLNLDSLALYWTRDGAAVLLRPNVDIDFRNGGDHEVTTRNISPALLPLDRVVHFDPDTGGGLVQASPHPHRMYAYRIKPGDHQDRSRAFELVKLADRHGLHTAAGTDLHPIVTTTSPAEMPSTRVLDPHGKVLGVLPSVAEQSPPPPNVQFVPNPSEPTFSRAGSSQVNGPEKDECFAAIVRPRDFDKTKKYPVLIDVYGGPRHLHVVQAMRNWLVPQWLADQGFIVVAIDNRGTPGRGRDWEKAVYQKFGTVPLEDQVHGLHALCARFPELDRERVGIVGWSFGGYMAANGVLRRPDVFKAAVAGAPVTDWEDYDTHYTERYMGLLPESRAAYDEASLIPLAKNLSRPLLLVHGTADDNVYYRHSLKLADALFRAGRPFEALPLPGVTHMTASDPVVMERLWARTATFFKQHLGGPK